MMKTVIIMTCVALTHLPVTFVYGAPKSSAADHLSYPQAVIASYADLVYRNYSDSLEKAQLLDRQIDRFLSRLPSGVQLFSMFHVHPHLLDLIAEIMGKAPRLADHLSNRPIILDSVLTQDFFDPPPLKQALMEELRGLLERNEYFEQKLDISRRWNADRRFQVGVQCLRGTLPPGDAGLAFSNIAEAALAGLFPVIEEEFAARRRVLSRLIPGQWRAT